jgi:epoxyqueuosine reductase
MKEAIRRRAWELGFDECRFTSADAPAHAEHFRRWLAAGRHGEMAYLPRTAEKRCDPQQVLPAVRCVIVLAASYAHAEIPAPPPAPAAGVVARYARRSDYHEVLGAPLQRLSAFVDQLGGPGTRSLAYVDTGPVLERDLAERAGAGFIGKHTNLLSRRLGNWFFLAEILTTLKLEPDPSERNHCGSCTRCLTACPTRAIVAPFELDARRCISYLTIELKGRIPEEFRPAIGRRIFGCDDCLEACPWNRFAREGRLLAAHARTDLETPDLVELLGLDEAAFKRRFAGTPLLRAKRRGLLRNVCVALGNVGAAAALPALARAAADPEPLIAEHARWAIAQIEARGGRRDAGPNPPSD